MKQMRIKDRRQKKELAAAIEQGHQLLAAQEVQEAREFLEEAVKQFPDDPEIRMLYASILLAVRPNDVAAEAAKAVELGPDNPTILVRAGHLLLGRGQVEAARSCAVQASELAKSDFVLLAALESLKGRLAALSGEDGVAEEQLRSAVMREPMYSTFTIDLAQFLADRGRQAEALKVIDDALDRTKDKADLERLRARLATEAPGS
jgi:Tfp pilus assembly protein PilF